TFTGDLYSAAKEQLGSACTVLVGRALVHFAGCSTLLAGRASSEAGSTKMAESIGEKLRLARETRGIALRDISEQTRISMRYLEAIEVDDYRRLPGGIFNRSFVRAYAKHIGYDEQQALEEYSAMMRERGEATDEASNRQTRSLVYTDNGGSR